MPFYIRKSVSVGPFRFNLSKSGIGMSAGVKGLRLGTGPRGNYIHMGRKGLYYRASLDAPRSRNSAAGEPRAPEQAPASGSMEQIEVGDILQMVDSNAHDVLEQINHKLATRAIWPFVLSIGLVAALLDASAALFAITTVVTALSAYFDKMRKSVVLMYDLDAEAAKAFEDLTHSFDRLMQASKKWNVETHGSITDWKRNAGATAGITRSAAFVGYRTPTVVKTNVIVPAIEGGRQSLYFFPDLMLVLERRKAGGVNYRHLTVECAANTFIEEEAVPSDAKVIGHRWRYMNKSGGPDKRFNNNSQIPVVQYQSVHLHGESGLNKLLQISREEDRTDLTRALAHLGVIVEREIASDAPKMR